jgi:thermolysin
MGVKSLSSGVICVTLAVIVLCTPEPAAQSRRPPSAVTATSVGELRLQDARMDRMVRGGDLRIRESVPDKLVPGRRIERTDQYYRGVRVFGGGVTRQLASGQTVSIFGSVYDDINVDPSPSINELEARRRVEVRTGVRLGPSRAGELTVLPGEQGGHTLTWRLRAFDGTDLRVYFVDAHTGAIVFDYSDLQTQSAVGRATGVLGDTNKKMSAMRFSGSFSSEDLLRPPAIRTYDMKGNPERVLDVVNGFATLNANDIGTDTDNVWTDGAVVDAHVYAGYTYDYYFRRFNRRGLNDANIRMINMVHPVRREEYPFYAIRYPLFFANAAYYGNATMVYGVGLPSGVTSGGRTWNHTPAAIDIVAHELTHGVTDYTSDLIYQNESGALNESFSDIIGAAVEFMFQPLGSNMMQADYLMGEDAVRPAGIRSFSNPNAYGHPDHYSVRFTGTADGGGVHINSSISNHAFYLAVEGGTNRISGIAVQGIGAANRVQIETIFYRAITQLLPSNATFAMARDATIQAARDLYGANSAAERAITDAWTAVGVN